VLSLHAGAAGLRRPGALHPPQATPRVHHDLVSVVKTAATGTSRPQLRMACAQHAASRPLTLKTCSTALDRTVSRNTARRGKDDNIRTGHGCALHSHAPLFATAGRQLVPESNFDSPPGGRQFTRHGSRARGCTALQALLRIRRCEIASPRATGHALQSGSTGRSCCGNTGNPAVAMAIRALRSGHDRRK